MADSAEIERLKDAVVAAAETWRESDMFQSAGSAATRNALRGSVDALRAARRPKWQANPSISDPEAWLVQQGAWTRALFYGPTAEADARAYAATKESQG